MCLSVSQAARKLAITEVDLERAEARLEAAEAWVSKGIVGMHAFLLPGIPQNASELSPLS